MKGRNFVNARGGNSSHERYIYGSHVIGEWLRSLPQHLRVLYYDPRTAKRVAPLLETAATAGVALEPVEERVLTTMVGSARHQGVVAHCSPFPYAEFDSVLQRRPDLMIVADHLQDPHNLGALLRTAEAARVGAVIVPKDAAVAVTPAVEAAAAGAAALVLVSRVTNLARTLRSLRQCGYWVAGLVPRSGIPLFEFSPPKPLVIVVGGEHGMRPLVAQHCDLLLSIPMFGRVESLNAGISAAVAVYHVRREWGEDVGVP